MGFLYILVLRHEPSEVVWNGRKRLSPTAAGGRAGAGTEPDSPCESDVGNLYIFQVFGRSFKD